MLSSKIDTYIMLFGIYLDGTVYISELFWNFLSFIHNNRIIMGGGALFFVHPLYIKFNLLTFRRYIATSSELYIMNKHNMYLYIHNNFIEHNIQKRFTSHISGTFKGDWQQKFLSVYLKDTPKQYIEVYYRIFVSALLGEIF